MANKKRVSFTLYEGELRMFDTLVQRRYRGYRGILARSTTLAFLIKDAYYKIPKEERDAIEGEVVGDDSNE